MISDAEWERRAHVAAGWTDLAERERAIAQLVQEARSEPLPAAESDEQLEVAKTIAQGLWHVLSDDATCGAVADATKAVARELLSSRLPFPSGGELGDHDPRQLNELAELIAGDGFVVLSTRYGAATRILEAGWHKNPIEHVTHDDACVPDDAGFCLVREHYELRA